MNEDVVKEWEQLSKYHAMWLCFVEEDMTLSNLQHTDDAWFAKFLHEKKYNITKKTLVAYYKERNMGLPYNLATPERMQKETNQ